MLQRRICCKEEYVSKKNMFQRRICCKEEYVTMREAEKEFEKGLEIIPKETLPYRLIFDEPKFGNYHWNVVGCVVFGALEKKEEESN
jgi:hypothetical protein